MPTLFETQQALFNALVAADRDGAASQIVGGALSPGERLDVYRNTFISSLTAALRISYPAVHRLVGEAFFESATQCFVLAHPPRTAYLNAYGAEFADFLAHFPPVELLPYLGDVARLEWAVNIALHANDVPAMDGEAFARMAEIPPDRLILVAHPSITLLRLDHPGREIWRAVLAEDDAALSTIDCSAGPQWLMVERNATGVEVLSLPETEWRLAAALCAGEAFAKVMEAAVDTDFSLLFASLLAGGRFTGFRLAGDHPPASLETMP
jgi:hypothetical protein